MVAKINIGIDVEIPRKTCNDRECPFHGKLKVHGKVFTAKVIRSKMQKTATVEWSTWNYIRKYQRYERRRTRVKAHNPPCIKALEGDSVKIVETRQLSKTKHFVIVEKK